MKAFQLIVLVFVSNLAFSQSIKGNLSSEKDNKSLGYGNVDVYQNNKLVASVLTDREGNFNVALDTGTYICVVSYAGFETYRKTINVQRDERADFTIKEDQSKPRPAIMSEVRSKAEDAEPAREGWAYGMEEKSPVKKTYGYEVDHYDALSIGKGSKAVKAVSGALSAGEVNDFSKWKAWNDLTEGELTTYQKNWDLAPRGRYTLELQSRSGLPLVNAKVKLIDGKATLFATRTDNTGKAEMWLNLSVTQPIVANKLQIEVDYQGQKKTVRDVKPFEKSINYLILDVECSEVNNVDIAFVVDATGSMGDELNYLKEELNDIIYKSKQISDKLNFRFANVFYRDEGPMEQYLTRSMDFSRVLSESVAFIADQRAGGGGDYEEAVETALDTAINKLSWSEDARARVVFLILDAPPHNNEVRRAKLARLVKEAAEKGIRIVPVGASGINKSTEFLMRSIALSTNGTYTFLTNHSGIGGNHIEPSTDDYKVETLNEIMVRVLKSYTYMPDCEQQIPDLDLDYPDSVVQVTQVDSLTVADSLNQQIPNPVEGIRWSYYPNPTNGIINVVSSVDIEELYLTDLTGKVLQIIRRIEQDRIVQVDLSTYVTGIYLLRYPHEQNWISGKVVLHRN